MPDLSLLATPAPYHILSYGTLLGTQMFQSFVGGIVAYKALPRPQFASLQQAIFPVYFAMTTALPVVLALTYPSDRGNGGLGGSLLAESKSTALVPIGVMFATSLVNWVALGPATTKVMRERKHQETRDGKKSYDAPPHSKEMMRLNRKFGMLHGASSAINMVGLLATVWYGVCLSERMR
ncbi:MAG: hypothetical protein M1833_002371 [Piccolia ochrophora]|nr:MAG: hypothetical protein M1833_002371 [Piccolia ochrophora]